METPPDRTYKHQLSADDFIFAFTATAETFAQRQDEMRDKGVERLSKYDVLKQYLIDVSQESDDHWFTCFDSVEVLAQQSLPLIVHDLANSVPSWVLKCCSLPSLLIRNCSSGETADETIKSKSTSFYLSETIAANIIIDNSEIYNVCMYQSKLGNLDITQKSTISTISINQSTTGDFDVRQSNVNEIRVMAKSTIGDFKVRKSTIEEFEIDQSNIGALLLISSVIGGITLYGSKAKDFSIRQKSVTGKIHIGQKSSVGYFFIRQQSIVGDFEIFNSDLAGFVGSDMNSSFSFYKAIIPLLRLNLCQIPELTVGSGCRLELYVAKSDINLIDLEHLTLSKESVVSLYNCKLYACLMEEFAVLGNLYFRQINKLEKPFDWYDPQTLISNTTETCLSILREQTHTYRLHLNRLLGEGQGELNIRQPTFRIAQSSLGKTEFTDCDLGGFRFEFNNAKLTEAFMSGGTVPDEDVDSTDGPNVVICRADLGSLVWHEQKVSLYNQLKKLFDGQGDIYRSTKFGALTAKHQQRTLQIRLGHMPTGQPSWIVRVRQNPRKALLATFPTDLTLDALTFWLNQQSNRHGESWGRALIFTVLAPIPFYILFLLAGGRLFIPDAVDWRLAPSYIDWNFLGYYFTFLDPTHRIDFLSGKGVVLSGWSSLIDFLGRVVVGYGLYQFIAAFRKHGRK